MSRFGPSTNPSSVIRFHMIRLATAHSLLTACISQAVYAIANRCHNASGFSETTRDASHSEILPPSPREAKRRVGEGRPFAARDRSTRQSAHRLQGLAAMNDIQRSGCPINLTLEVVGDKWSLLIIRDIMFGNRRHYRELLTRSEEGISSNILADRLKMLLQQGIITRQDDPNHKQKGIYSLTQQGIELLPI